MRKADLCFFLRFFFAFWGERGRGGIRGSVLPAGEKCRGENYFASKSETVVTWRKIGRKEGGEAKLEKKKKGKKKERKMEGERGSRGEGKKRREGTEKVRRGRAVNNIASIYVFMRREAEKPDLVALVHLLLPMLYFLSGLSGLLENTVQDSPKRSEI